MELKRTNFYNPANFWPWTRPHLSYAFKERSDTKYRGRTEIRNTTRLWPRLSLFIGAWETSILLAVRLYDSQGMWHCQQWQLKRQNNWPTRLVTNAKRDCDQLWKWTQFPLSPLRSSFNTPTIDVLAENGLRQLGISWFRGFFGYPLPICRRSPPWKGEGKHYIILIFQRPIVGHSSLMRSASGPTTSKSHAHLHIRTFQFESKYPISGSIW